MKKREGERIEQERDAAKRNISKILARSKREGGEVMDQTQREQRVSWVLANTAAGAVPTPTCRDRRIVQPGICDIKLFNHRTIEKAQRRRLASRNTN